MTHPGGTARCTVTTGFFVLGRCGGQAVAACTSCGRPVCPRHVVPGSFCSECAAAQGYGGSDPYHPGWTRGYRRTYYQQSAAEYGDAGWYGGFDSYDRGAFDPGGSWDSGGDYGSDDGGDYVDS